MALFKILRGPSSGLAQMPLKDGYCYFTPDTGLFHVDYEVAPGDIRRIPISASTLNGATVAQTLRDEELEIPSSALLYALNESINGHISAVQSKANEAYELAGVQSDWSVNDPEDPAYVKDRTHYIKDLIWNDTPIVEEQTFSITDLLDGSYLGGMYISDAANFIYKIKFNGAEYVCPVTKLNNTAPSYTILLLGNSTFLPPSFGELTTAHNNEPFLIVNFQEGGSYSYSYLFTGELGDFTVEIIEGLFEVEKLNSMFINEDIVRVEQLENYSTVQNLRDGYASGLEQTSASFASSDSVALGRYSIAKGYCSYS